MGRGVREGSEVGPVTVGGGSCVSGRGALAAVRPQAGASPPWTLLLSLTWVFPSRVHITEATLSHLDKTYEVEDGHGHLRDPYLKEMNIRTYLVIDPRVWDSEAAAEGHTRGRPLEGERGEACLGWG